MYLGTSIGKICLDVWNGSEGRRTLEPKKKEERGGRKNMHTRGKKKIRIGRKRDKSKEPI